MYLSTARTTWNVARDVSGRIALSLAVRVRSICDEQSTVYLFRFFATLKVGPFKFLEVGNHAPIYLHLIFAIDDTSIT